MSLVEPESASQRAARRGTGPSGRLQWVCLVLGVVAAIVTGDTVAGLHSGSSPGWIAVLIPSGALVFVIFLAAQSWSLNAALGSGGSRVWLRPGGFLGVVALVMGLACYLRIGEDPNAPRAKYLAPLIVGTVLLALSVTAALHRRRRAAGWARARDRMHATGVITDDGLAGRASSPTVTLTRVVVRYRDSHGADRWLTPLARQVPAHPLRAGDPVDVWFDPADPGASARILVEGGNGTSQIIPSSGRGLVRR